MKHVWKRAMSLLLSGVLLVGNVPFAALATEEPVEELIVEEVLEEVIQTPETQPTDPAATTTVEIPPVTDTVANADAEPQDNSAIDYPVMVGDSYVTSANAADILGNGTVSFATATKDGVTTNTLTLKNAAVSSISWGAFENLGPELVVFLPEGTESTISGGLKAEGDLSGMIRIVGKGKLNIEKVEASHLIVKEGELVAALNSDGYARTTETGAFSSVAAGSKIEVTAEKPYYEYVAGSHLDWVKTETEHYKTCAEEKCTLREYMIVDQGEHVKLEAATCVNKAKCKICGEYGKTEPHDYTKYEISEDKTSLNQLCEDCDHASGKTITVAAPEGTENNQVIWDGEAQKVTVDHAGAEIIYYQDAVPENGAGGSQDAPDAPGNYVAVVTINIDGVSYKLQRAFTIAQKELTEDMVVLDTDAVTYDATAKVLPTVIVAASEVPLEEDTDYEVAFTRDGVAVINGSEALVNAGVIDVTVTGKGNYTGIVKKTFTIEQADASVEMFDVTLPDELVYDAKAKSAEVKIDNTVQGMGDIELRYYRKGEESQPVDAGDYEVKVYVKGTGNYKEAEIADAGWSFTIVGSDAYTDATIKEQVVGFGVGELQLPNFVGIAKEQVNGSCVYTFTYEGDTETVAENKIEARLADMHDGDEATLSYVFTPAADSNYTGETKGEIKITVVSLTFAMDDGTDVTAEQLKKQGTITYGDADLVDVSKLMAKAAGAEDAEDAHFVVKYAMAKQSGGYDEENLLDAPNAGSCKFIIFYSGKLGDHTFTDVEVCNGILYVNPKDPSISEDNLPKAELLKEKADGSAQPLLLEGKEGKTDDGAALEYCLTENGTYSADIPEVTDAGYYELWYRTPRNGNYTTPGVKGKVQILVLPHLTATYGQTLGDIKDQLPDGFTFHEPDSKEADKVGNVGEYTEKVDFTHPKDDGSVENAYPTLTGESVTLVVSPKSIAPTMTLNESAYDKDKDGYIHYDNRAKSNVFVVKDGEKSLSYTTEHKDYTVTVQLLPGFKSEHTITPTETGNYVFDPIKAEVKLYRPDHSALAEDNFPDEKLKDTEYETLAKAKAALSKKIESDDYPTDEMEYVKVYMTKTSDHKTFTENTANDACPTAGYTYEIPYSDLGNAVETDSFKVSVIYYTADTPVVEELDDEQITNSANALKLTLDREAIVCVAKKVDLTHPYEINKHFVYDGKTTTTSTRGSLTITVDSSETEAKTATYGKTVKVVAKANSGYSIEGVTVTKASGEKVTTTQSGTTYTFKMPADNVTVKLSLKKTTSSSKNPYSGDTSNIYLWLTILAASAVGIVALVIVWFKKRKK